MAEEEEEDATTTTTTTTATFGLGRAAAAASPPRHFPRAPAQLPAGTHHHHCRRRRLVIIDSDAESSDSSSDKDNHDTNDRVDGSSHNQTTTTSMPMKEGPSTTTRTSTKTTTVTTTQPSLSIASSCSSSSSASPSWSSCPPRTNERLLHDDDEEEEEAVVVVVVVDPPKTKAPNKVDQQESRHKQTDPAYEASLRERLRIELSTPDKVEREWQWRQGQEQQHEGAWWRAPWLAERATSRGDSNSARAIAPTSSCCTLAKDSRPSSDHGRLERSARQQQHPPPTTGNLAPSLSRLNNNDADTEIRKEQKNAPQHPPHLPKQATTSSNSKTTSVFAKMTGTIQESHKQPAAEETKPINTTVTSTFKAATANTTVMAEQHSNEESDAMMDVDNYDDDASKERGDALPTLEELETICWKCHDRVQRPRTSNNVGDNDADGKFCCYAMHEHPMLDNVPVCSVCRDDIVAAVEDAAAVKLKKETNGNSAEENTGAHDDDDDDDVCLACGRAPSEDEDDVLLLCDSCPNACCLTCLAQAHGSWQVARRQSKETGDWHCLLCTAQSESAPPLLTCLQQRYLEESQKLKQQQGKRNVDDILVQLSRLEQEKSECDATNEREEELRNEIRTELQQQQPHLSGDEVESLVEEEWCLHEQISERHERRLADWIAILLDELEFEHEVDVAATYHKCFGFARRQQHTGDDESADSEEDEPAWVRKANKAVTKIHRGKNMEKSNINILKLEAYEKETYDDVEELEEESLTTEPIASLSTGWITTARPSQKQVDEAMQEENEKLRKLHVAVVNAGKDTDDQAATMAEDEEISTIWRLRSRGNRREGTAKHISVMPMEVSPADKTSAVAAQAGSGETAVSNSLHPREAVSTPDKQLAAPALAKTSSQQSANSVTPRRKLVTPSLAPRPAPVLPTERVFANQRSQPAKSASFEGSNLILCSESEETGGVKNVRTVAVAPALANVLKPHQIEGVKFIWGNCLSDFACNVKGDERSVGGCIL